MKKLKFRFKGIYSDEEGYYFTFYVIDTDNNNLKDKYVIEILDILVKHGLLPTKTNFEGKFTVDFTMPHSTTVLLIVDNEKIDGLIHAFKEIHEMDCFAKEDSIETKKIKALNEFAKQNPQLTSSDLEIFVEGMNAMQNLM